MKKTGFLLGALLATLVISAYQYYAARAANSLQISRDFQLVQNSFNLKIFQWFIDDNTHRAVFIVFTNINHGAAKNRVLESRHGNKKVML